MVLINKFRLLLNTLLLSETTLSWFVSPMFGSVSSTSPLRGKLFWRKVKWTVFSPRIRREDIPITNFMGIIFVDHINIFTVKDSGSGSKIKHLDPMKRNLFVGPLNLFMIKLTSICLLRTESFNPLPYFNVVDREKG